MPTITPLMLSSEAGQGGLL